MSSRRGFCIGSYKWWDEINGYRWKFSLISLGLSNKVENLWHKFKKSHQNQKIRKIWPRWLFEHCLDFQNWISPSLWLIVEAAPDNFWNFIQMNYWDPGWSNTNGDVTDLRSTHLLPVCGLWIIRGPVGPRSGDLFVKEFEKKGSCIAVHTPISSQNPFTAEEGGTCLFTVWLLKSTRKGRRSGWLKLATPEEHLCLKWVPAKQTVVSAWCRWPTVIKVRMFLFWCLQTGLIVTCELGKSQDRRKRIKQSL